MMYYQNIDLELAKKKLPLIINRLHDKGMKIGVRETLLSINILDSFLLLANKKSVTFEEFNKILESVIAKNDYEEKIVNETLSEIFHMENNNRKELELAYEKFKNKLINRSDLSGNMLENFLKLLAIGGVVKRGKYYRTVEKEKLEELIDKLNDFSLDYNEKLKNMIKNLSSEEIVKIANTDLFYNYLNVLSLDKLIRIADLLNKKHHNRQLKKVGDVIKEKLKNSNEMEDQEKLWRALKSLGILDKEMEKALILKDPSLSKKTTLNLNEIESLNRDSFNETNQKAIINYAKTVKDKESLNKVLQNVDLKNLWLLEKSPISGEEGILINAAIYSSMALKEALEYAQTGNEGRKSMSNYYLQRSSALLNEAKNEISIGKINKENIESLESDVRRIMEYIETKKYDQLKNIDLISYIDILRSLYSRSDIIERKKLIFLAEMYISHILYIKGFKTIPIKKKYNYKPGRLLVKDSVMNIIRNKEDFLVYRRKVKSKKIGLALDISGSMYKYSSWALSLSSLFIQNISRLVLFSSKAYVYNKINKNKIINLLLSIEFKGYTDISNALELFKDGKLNHIVVITDLKQTIKNKDPTVVTREITNKGIKLIFIVPNNIEKSYADLFKNNGGTVKIVRNPEQLAKELVKVLS